MYILKNALHNVLQNRGRNILIGAIILVVIVTTVITIMIRNTANGIIDDYKGRFGSEVRLEPNMQKIREEAMANSKDGRVMITIPTIPADHYIAFGESEYLQSSLYTARTGVNSENITAIDAELGAGSGLMRMGGGPGMSEGEPMQFMLSLFGNKFTEFEDGMRELAEGRMPEERNEGIISTDLAEKNGIQIGDKLSLYGELNNMMEGKRADISYELTVVGTYYDATDEYSEGSMKNAFTNRRNEILTTYETVVQEIQPDMSGIKVEATYFLKQPDMLDAFAEEVYDKGLEKTFEVTTDEASYNKIIGPVEGLKGVAVTFMAVVLILGGIIITLLSSISIRERKYEIGVLRAMGMKKRKVAFGLWSEILIITCACLAVGLGAGSLSAQPVTNALLANQIEMAEEAANQQPSGGNMMMMAPQSSFPSADVEPLSSIDLSLNMNSALQIIGIALLLVSLASLLSITRITKYEPIKILMERN